MRLQEFLQPAALLLFSFVFIDTTTARPRNSVPISRDGNYTQETSLALVPRDLASPSATPFPLPDPAHFPVQFALEGGWSVAVNAFSYIYPLSSSTTMLENFFTGIQAYALARMLQGFSNPCRPMFAQGDFALVLQMHPRSTVGTVEWSIVYAFAGYMLKWVRRGFSGNGGLLFHHKSGVMMAAAVLNHDSVGLPQNTVYPEECPQ